MNDLLICLVNFDIFFYLFVCFISFCKIYKEKTIEVGVYIDRHLYKNMEQVKCIVRSSFVNSLLEYTLVFKTLKNSDFFLQRDFMGISKAI